MKKLMTMLAAVGMAFGLFAEEPDPIVDANDFASVTQESFSNDTQWTYNGAATKPIDKVWVANSLLNLATGSDKVQRTFVPNGAATITDAIYFDANINFEDPFDEAPVISDSDNAKVAAFVLDNSGIIEELGEAAKVAASTNLYVIAGYNNNGTWEKRAFMFATPADEGIADKFAKRLTIKAYGDVMDGAATRMGFRFFLNGNTDIKNALAVKYVFPINDDGSIDFTTFIDADDTTTPYLGTGVKASLKAAVRSRCSDQTLVLALAESAAELTGFDLAGKGELANFTLTTESPTFIAEDAYTMTVDYENAAFASISPDTIPYEGGTITFYDSTQITLTVTPNENYTIVKWFLNGGEEAIETGTSCSFTPVNLAQLHVKAYKEEATLTYIDADANPQTVNCTSVIDAFAKAGELEGATNIKITLGEFAGEEGVITIADADLSIYGITVTGDVTLDLAGKTLKGGSTFETGTVDPTINVNVASSLTVVDSIGGGAIANPAFTAEEMGGAAPLAISTYGGTITFSAVTGDKFYTIGTIDPTILDPSYVSIAGGKFTKNNNKDAIVTALAPGDLEVVGDDDDVWTVQKIQGYTIMVDSAEHGSVTTDPADKAAAGETVTITATPYQDYKLGAITVAQEDGTPVDVGEDGTFEMPAANVTVSATFIAKDYVAQIVGGQSFETLAEAFAAVQDAETIKLLAAVTEGVLYEGAKKFTIDLNGQTWTWNGGQKGNWAALKVFGGAADITIVDNAAGGKMYAAGDGFCIWAKSGTVTINSGKFYNNSNDDYAIYVNGTAQVVINDGEFRNEKDAPYIWKDDLAKLNLNVENNNPNATITVYGGTYSAEPKDDSGIKFVAEGKKAVENKGIWTVKDIEYATLTIATVENLTISVTNAEGVAQTTGDTFDKDLATKLYVTRTPASGYELDGYAATETITMSADVTVTGAVKSASQPVNPGEEKKYEKPEEAQAAAKAINDNKEASINVPTEAADNKTAYLERVAAKVEADGLTVVVDIAEGQEATFKGELDTEIKKDTVAAALTDATATKATIATVAGFYYWVEGGVEVGTIKTNGDAVIGTGSTVELTKPALGTTTKAFYKLAVGVKAPAK